MDRQNVTLQKKHTFMLQRITWYRKRGSSVPPKVLICRKSEQNRWKGGQKWRPMLFDFNKWHPTFPEKHTKTFVWRSYQKKVFMIFYLCGEILLAKSHKTFRARLGNSGKNLSHPQKFPSPKPMYIYRFLNQIWMVFRHERNRKTFWV